MLKDVFQGSFLLKKYDHILGMLDRADAKVSFFGGRVITIEGEGTVSLSDLAKFTLDSGKLCAQEGDWSLDSRIKLLEIKKKISAHFRDAKTYACCHLVRQFFMWIRDLFSGCPTDQFTRMEYSCFGSFTKGQLQKTFGDRSLREFPTYLSKRGELYLVDEETMKNSVESDLQVTQVATPSSLGACNLGYR